jgi:GDP-L-fucose synthase
MSFYQNKKVFVTGGHGFIGSHLVDKLKKLKAQVIAPTRKELDLALAQAINPALKNVDYLFHLAAHVGGIQYNNAHPGSLLYQNTIPTLNVVEAARLNNVKRTLIVSSACVYPRFCTIPTPEAEGFKDEPEPTNYGYGWSKRVAEILAKTYAQEYKMKIGLVRPYNVYGPGDNFDLNNSHVIPALVKKICDGQNPVTVWGDGSATRSFIYVTDVVEAMLLSLEKHPKPDPINLGTKEEISIKNLTELIIKLSGQKTSIKFDKSKPNGQPRRNCDTSKAEKILTFQATTSLKQGLPSVIKYYQEHVQNKA